MKPKHPILDVIIGFSVGLMATIYFTAGCKSAPDAEVKHLPRQPYVVQNDATGLWKWQYVSSNNFLVVESLGEYGSPKEAADNYRAAREALSTFPDPRIEREIKL